MDESRHFLGARPRSWVSFSFTDHEIRMKTRCHADQFFDVGVLAITCLAQDNREPAALAA